MEIPKNVKVHELSSSFIWLSPDGILYSTPKPGPVSETTTELVNRDMAKIREVIGDKKVCMISESNPNTKPVKKEQRDFIAEQISSIVKAIAIIATSPVSRMLANLFFSFKPPSYPVKMCSNEAEAHSWIKQYL